MNTSSAKCPSVGHCGPVFHAVLTLKRIDLMEDLGPGNAPSVPQVDTLRFPP